MSYSRPVITVEIVGETMDEVIDERRRILDRISSLAKDSQQELGIKPAANIITEPAPSVEFVSYVGVRNTTAVLALALLTIGLAAGIPLSVDRALAGRGRRRRRPTAPACGCRPGHADINNPGGVRSASIGALREPCRRLRGPQPRLPGEPEPAAGPHSRQLVRVGPDVLDEVLQPVVFFDVGPAAAPHLLRGLGIVEDHFDLCPEGRDIAGGNQNPGVAVRGSRRSARPSASRSPDAPSPCPQG